MDRHGLTGTHPGAQIYDHVFSRMQAVFSHSAELRVARPSLLIYCYATGRFSSRSIEQATYDDITVSIHV